MQNMQNRLVFKRHDPFQIMETVSEAEIIAAGENVDSAWSIPFPGRAGWAMPRQPFRFPHCAPRWVTAIGAWGDCIIALGIIQETARRYPDAQPFGLIWIGRDPCVAHWLLRQKFGGRRLFDDSRSIISVFKGELAEYWDFIGGCCNKTLEGVPWWPDWLEEQARINETPSFDASAVLNTHLTVELQHAVEPVLADIEIRRTPGCAIVAHPWSLQSCDASDHWPKTADLMWRLQEEFPHSPVTLTGLKKDNVDPYPCDVDMRDKHRSMSEVFLEAHSAALVVTTSCGLAHYCAATRIPCVVLLKRNDQALSGLFRRNIEHGQTVRTVSYRGSVEDALALCREGLYGT